MDGRHLFLIGYDISDPDRLVKALKLVRCHALGGQKSFYECWLTTQELQQTRDALNRLIDPETDRVVFILLNAGTESLRLGSTPPIDHGNYFLVA
jgi:CRISPR-associated protein Cas2